MPEWGIVAKGGAAEALLCGCVGAMVKMASGGDKVMASRRRLAGYYPMGMGGGIVMVGRG